MISLGSLGVVKITIAKPKLTKKARKRRALRRKYAALILIAISATIFFSHQVAASLRPAPAIKSNPVQQAKPVQPSKGLTASQPVNLQIDAIGLNSPLQSVGLDTTGAIEVPATPNTAGWYSASRTPGEVGPAIIVGHLDNADGPALFWRLHELQPGVKIAVARQDGHTAFFTVTEIGQYTSDNYPVDKIYGATSTAELRLITCGGTLNLFTGHYEANTVVYATLTQ